MELRTSPTSRPPQAPATLIATATTATSRFRIRTGCPVEALAASDGRLALRAAALSLSDLGPTETLAGPSAIIGT
ncbi:MAG: hypothetical protein ACT452_20255 [Microthrixaceae bacterium]